MREKVKNLKLRLTVLLVGALMAAFLLGGTAFASSRVAWGQDARGYYWVKVNENNQVVSGPHYYGPAFYIVRWILEGDSTTTIGSSATIGLVAYTWDGTKGAPYSVTYTSSDPSIAYIPNSSSGTVVGKKPGTVTITGSCPYGSATMTFSVTCNHQFDDGRVTEKPTCKSLGTKLFTCKTCGYTYQQAIPVIDHDLSWKIQKASLESNGRTQEVCSMCGTVFDSKTIYRPKKLVLSRKVFTYNGKVQRPDVVVKDAKGVTIPEEYYKVKYSKGSKTAGVYTVVVTFKGRYTGMMRADYKIK